jgi:hypothetical protein
MGQLDRVSVLVLDADEAHLREALSGADWEERGLLRRLVRTDLESPWRRFVRALRPPLPSTGTLADVARCVTQHGRARPPTDGPRGSRRTA